MNGLLTRAPEQLYRVRFTWVANGVSRYPDPSTEYVEFTPRDVVRPNAVAPPRYSDATPGNLDRGVVVPGSSGPVDWCNGFQTEPGVAPPAPYTGPFALDLRLACFAARAPGLSAYMNQTPRGFVGYEFTATFPVELAAIDPVQEARLLHFDRAIVSGRYLRPGEGARVVQVGGGGQRQLPVIASSRTFLREQLEVSIQRLGIPVGVNVQRALSVRALLPEPAPRVTRFLAGLSGPVVARRNFSFAREYRSLLASGPLQSDSYWTVSPTRYRALGPDRLSPLSVSNPISVWQDPAYPGYGGYFPAPPDNRDVQFRRLHPHVGSNLIQGNVSNLPSLRVVGRYDPDRLPGFSPLSRVPLET